MKSLQALSTSTAYIASSVGSIFNDSLGGSGDGGGEDDWTTPTLRAHVGIRSVLLPASGAMKAPWLEELLNYGEGDREEGEGEEPDRDGLRDKGQGDKDTDGQVIDDTDKAEAAKATTKNEEVKQAAEDVVKHKDWIGMVLNDFKGRWRFWGFEKQHALDRWNSREFSHR